MQGRRHWSAGWQRGLQGHDTGEAGVGVGGVVHSETAAKDGLSGEAQGESEAGPEGEAEGMDERMGEAGGIAGLNLGTRVNPSEGLVATMERWLYFSV